MGQQPKSDAEGQDYPSWHSVVAGGAAGLGSRVATAPLDFLRIRRQLNIADASIWKALGDVYHGEGGVFALYRGNLAAIFLWVGYAACQFSVYYRVKDYLPEGEPTRAFVSGAVAGSVALLATYPLDVCRTNMVAHGILSNHLVFPSLYDPQTLPPGIQKPHSLTECARKLYQTRGLRGFYAGVAPALVQIVPYMGINFALYEALSKEQTSVSLSAYAGSVSGAVSKMIVYPLDTVKRRLQAQAFYASAIHYNGMLDCFVRVAKEEGFNGFYRGIVPSVLKTGLATSMSFAIYRWSKNLLEASHDRYYEPKHQS